MSYELEIVSIHRYSKKQIHSWRIIFKALEAVVHVR